jgi:hypothetical protein
MLLYLSVCLPACLSVCLSLSVCLTSPCLVSAQEEMQLMWGRHWYWKRFVEDSEHTMPNTKLVQAA